MSYIVARLNTNEEYAEKCFEDKEAANAAFLAFKRKGFKIATGTLSAKNQWDVKDLKFWNSSEEDWFIPVIYSRERYWEGDIGYKILEDCVKMHSQNGTSPFCDDGQCQVSISNKTFVVIGSLVKQDEMFASLYNEPDKFHEMTFIENDEEGEDLSSFAFEV